ncbi:MAG: D-alanyl-D-alanine carboxypeptidase family protein [Roseburia sp.]|nr:D-alanyl-D-alanine carboxypeptidase family protein [Roseburia sp.]MCM1097159.1 D-alanyl-D-alanine carboxypeptidase family protein [Ruminococcus flavefaciens]
MRRLKMLGYSLSILLILLAISACVGVVMFFANMSKVQDMAAGAVIELQKLEDGNYELSWAALEEAGADLYRVDVSTNALFSESGEKKTFYSGYVDGLSCTLPELPPDEGLVLEMELIKKYSVLGKERTTKQASIERYFSIWDPGIVNLDWEADPETGTAVITFDFHSSNSCSIYVTQPNGEKKFWKTLGENRLELNLEEEEDLWVPTTGNPCVLSFVAGNNANGIAVYSGEAKDIAITWEDFAARDIHLNLDLDESGTVCRLEWDKVDCDSYEIQMRDNNAGVWETIKTVTRADECTYVTPRLSPGAGYSFRIAAVLQDHVAVSEVQECEIAITPVYCTVWPVKNLKAYAEADGGAEVGQVQELDAHCIVDVKQNRSGKDMFGVMVNGQVGYIDSDFCMINLPEYVGALCNYDITNSYDSIFMAHGFEIPGLTGQTIKGFEEVQLQDMSFLVPLLYPSALKLVTAIDIARESGYRLKIYEAFRPHEASTYMYQKASAVQYATLPDETYWGDDPGVVLTITERDENGVSVTRRKTYWELMNDANNSFNLSAFVSAGISKHNIGVAMDLTLESLATGTELLMQTDLHDLSQYSARVQNNDYAKALSRIMMSAGFGDLYSEWWHFQDNEIRNKINLPCVDEGVTPNCWIYNGFGWRYRGVKGSYATNGTLTVDGKEYVFDADGYCQNYVQTESDSDSAQN